MEEEIKRITVKIDGETYGLEDALDSVIKKSKELQDELKKVEELLKLDPKNTELLTKKQKLLAESIQNTKEKLDGLKKAEDGVQKQFKKGDDIRNQYKDLSREISTTEKQLKDLENQAKKTEQSFDDIGDVPSKSSSSPKLDLDSAASNVLSGASNLVGDLVSNSLETRELREDMAQLEASAMKAGAGVEETEQALKSLNTISSDTEGNIGALSSLLDAGFTGNQMDEVLNNLSGAVLEFPDAGGIEGLASGLKETVSTGEAVGPFAELLNNMGISLEDFNAGLGECTTAAQEQQYILDTLANTGLAGVNEQYQKNNQSIIESKNAQFDLQQSLVDLGAVVEPIITMAMEKLSGLVRWITENKTAAMVLLGTITTLAAGFKTFMFISTITGLFKEYELATKAAALGQELFNKIASMNPIAKWAIIIGVVVGAIMYLWNTNEDFRNFIIGCWNSISEAVKPFIDKLINFFTVTLPEALSAFWAVIQPFVENVMNFFLVTVPEIMKPFVDGLINFFTVTLPEAFAIFCEAIRPIVEGVMSFFTVTIPELIKPFVDGIINFFTVTLPEAFGLFWEFIKEKVDAVINFFTVTFPEAFANFFALIESFFTTDWSGKFGVIGLVINAFIENAKSMFSGFKLIFTGVIDFIKNVFKGDWEGAWQSVVDTFGLIFEGIKEKAKIPINCVLSILNMAIEGINTLIRGINDISIKVPDEKWVPSKFRGISLGFDIPEIGEIPMLAKGGVLSHGEAIVAEAGPELIQMINGKAVVTPLTHSSRNTSVGTLDARGVSGGDIIVNNYSPKALTAAESARYFKRAQRELALGVR